ncbi:amyAc_bac_euk_AmyA and Aamy_C domain-containing protein isoform X3 [Carassius gibelio]|uniref:amyAc_bac_euk_AmyA and Aamy_C domain-containing protein isoform X3 n=1 Tax=Carassius gibelio TaxID=101364 RepID=UPI0022777F1F|nr:amyAc_bac_euk_AmyA and Aamy_C domain-containing protein isoform X3 [Carassius gibelio]
MEGEKRLRAGGGWGRNPDVLMEIQLSKILILVALFGLGLAQHNPNMKNGRTSIVHLFEWRWADIAQECERYLAPNGYGGVQISPASEHVKLSNPWHPWWQRYQPIGYNLCSRSGTEAELKDMIARCNNVGVNIYVDVVINHMCKSIHGEGTPSSCGSKFNGNKEDFPSVPYSYLDFNDAKCKTGSGHIENYLDIYQVRDCRLEDLLDLALEKDYVRGKLAEYLNKLIDLGVAGFRVDACKHMWPGDLTNVYGRLKTLNTKWFPSGTKPFIYQEVIDLGGEPIKASEYYGLARVTEFKHSAKLGTVVRKWDGEKLSYLKNWGEGWGFMPSDRGLVFVDNHDNQRGHGAGGASVLTFWDSRLYKIATGLMLAHPYGVTRVMSSYRWDRKIVNGKDENDWMGPPSFSDGSTKPVPINPDSTCGDNWVCEHRWRQIRNMVIFRNVVSGQPLSNWWDNGNNQIAFSRGSKGFIVINNDDWALNVTLNTGLPMGTYCDVISGDKSGGSCTGKQVSVGSDGRATFSISNTDEDPFIAIHADSKL